VNETGTPPQTAVDDGDIDTEAGATTVTVTMLDDPLTLALAHVFCSL
jgi:hypothetical protein